MAAPSIVRTTSFSRSSGKVLHLADRREYLAHVEVEEAQRKLAAFNLLRAARVRELTDLMVGIGLPRFLREPADIKERVKALAANEASFEDAKLALQFAGTYTSRAEGWGEMLHTFGLRK